MSNFKVCFCNRFNFDWSLNRIKHVGVSDLDIVISPEAASAYYNRTILNTILVIKYTPFLFVLSIFDRNIVETPYFASYYSLFLSFRWTLWFHFWPQKALDSNAGKFIFLYDDDLFITVHEKLITVIDWLFSFMVPVFLTIDRNNF